MSGGTLSSVHGSLTFDFEFEERKPAHMSRTQLIVASLIADFLDLAVVGQIPFLSWIIDIPLIAMHVSFGGLHALYTILELAPGVGTLPIFTLAAIVNKPAH